MDLNTPLGPRIKHLCNAFDMAANRSAMESGLTGAQAFLLSYIARYQDPPLRARELEQRFNLRHPTISGMLQRMEANGFLICEPDETDRRCKRIRMTQKAYDTYEQATHQLEQVETAMLSGFAPEEQELFSALLDKAILSLGALCPTCQNPKTEQSLKEDTME